MSLKVLVLSKYSNVGSSRPEAETFIKLQKMGFQIDVMSDSGSSYMDKFKEAGMGVISYHPSKKIDFAAIRKIRRILVDGNYDIIHLFNSKTVMNGILASLGLPVKVFLYRGYTGNIRWFDPFMYLKHLSPFIDGVWCISNATRDLINNQRIFGKIARTIHKGHELEWYQDIKPVDELPDGVEKDDFKLICVANNRSMKGLKYLIGATYLIPADIPFKLMLVGQGMEKYGLKKLIDHSPNRDKIKILGYRNDALSLVKSSDVFVLSSIYGEATTKSVIEAMSLGITPLATDISGNRELVLHEKNGIVVPRKNAKALADGIIRLYKNQDECRNLGIRAKNFIEEKFKNSDTAVNLGKYYKDVVSS